MGHLPSGERGRRQSAPHGAGRRRRSPGGIAMSSLARLRLLATFAVLIPLVLSWPTLTSGDDGPRQQAADDPEPRGKLGVPGPELREGGRREATGAVLTVKIIADNDTTDDKPAPLTVNGKATNLTGAERVFHT